MIAAFFDRYALSPETRAAVTAQMRNPAAINEQFVFNGEEFARQIAFRSVELDSGALLTAEASEFDVVFTQEVVGGDGSRVKYSAEGKVIAENLRKVR